jgi:hypothetical protein
MGTFRTITLKGTPIINNERLCSGTPKPGMLVSLNTSGVYVVHPTAGGGSIATTIALENEQFGTDLDTAYTTATLIRVGHFKPGDEVAVWLYNNENADIGSNLESNGDGMFRVAVADTSALTIAPGAIRFKSLEDTTAGSSGTLIRALVI